MAAVNYSTRNDLTVPAVVNVKVVSAVIDGRAAKLNTCLWAPTTAVGDKGSSDKARSKICGGGAP